MNRTEFMQRYILAVVAGRARVADAPPVPHEELARAARALHDAMTDAAKDVGLPATAGAGPDAAARELERYKAVVADIIATVGCPPSVDLRDHLGALLMASRSVGSLRKELEELRALAPDSEAVGLLRTVFTSMRGPNGHGFDVHLPGAWVDAAKAWLAQATTRHSIAEQSKEQSKGTNQ